MTTLKYKFECPKCSGGNFRSYEVVDDKWIRHCATSGCGYHFHQDEDWRHFIRIESKASPFESKEAFDRSVIDDGIILQKRPSKVLAVKSDVFVLTSDCLDIPSNSRP